MQKVSNIAVRLPVGQFTVLKVQRLAPAHIPAYRPIHGVRVRCLASRRDNGDKSWGDIAEEAKEVAKDFARKVGSGISGAIAKVLPSEEERAIKHSEQEERARRELYRGPGVEGGIFSGLLGRAVGRMLQGALGAVGEQLRQAAEQVADVQSRAVAMIESDPRVRDRLGGSVQCLAPMSQSSMTQSINGRVSRVVTLVLPVVGAGGRAAAQAEVRWVENADAAGEQLSVTVRLPSGEVVRVDGGGRGGSSRSSSSSSKGNTIDVEWREV
ncbi:hypothetical protein N2152v2_008918 [Parachlorella kessleri]